MHNTEVLKELDDCTAELQQIDSIIRSFGPSSHVVPFLTKYAVVRACGTTERAFKKLIADHCSYRSKRQVKQYISKKIREGSANPSYSKMCEMLGDFDDIWCKRFKTSVDAEPNPQALRFSLQSLVDARNDFAHGGNPSASIGDIITYHLNARRLIEIIDAIIR